MYFVRNFRISVYGPEMNNIRAKPVEREDFDGLPRLRDYMLEVMQKFDGIGLAAPQIGLFKRFLIFENSGKITALVNPVITRMYGKEQEGLEGCLSLPPVGNECCVPRMEVVEVEASTVEKPDIKKQFTFRKLTARVVQHEIDHLSGTFFIDRVSEKSRRLVLEDFGEWKRKQQAQSRNSQGGIDVDAGVVAAYRGQSRLS